MAVSRAGWPISLRKYSRVGESVIKAGTSTESPDVATRWKAGRSVGIRVRMAIRDDSFFLPYKEKSRSSFPWELCEGGQLGFKFGSLFLDGDFRLRLDRPCLDFQLGHLD